MEQAYREHAQTVYRYLLSLTQDPSLAEELTQETFYQAVQTAHRYDGSCKVSTWLCAIARNVLRTYRRKHPEALPLEAAAQVPDPAPPADAAALDRLNEVALLKRLHSLPADTREVLYLRLLGGLSFSQIGEIMGRTETWARVTCYRGREALKKELIEDEGS